jgi:hypothetical protein
MARIAGLALLLPLACVHAQKSEPPPSELARFADLHFAAYFVRNPATATATGFHEYDGKLTDYSRAGNEARAAELKVERARLASLRAAGLPFDDAIDAELLAAAIEGELVELEGVRSLENNPMEYVADPAGAVDVLIKRDFAPPIERLRSALARTELAPRTFAAARENVKNPPRELTELSIRMLRGTIGFFEQTAPAWARAAAGGDQKLLADFEAACARAAAAGREYLNYLQDELLPNSHGTYAIGEKNFLDLLKYEEMIELPLAELLARGEANLSKDRAAFIEVAGRIDAGRSPAEVMKLLEDDHPSEGDLIDTVARSVEAARKFVIDKDLVAFPSEVRVRVEPTPAYQRDGSFASMRMPGAFETKATEAFYYVTPVEPEWDAKHKEEHLRLFNRWVVGMIDVHEAYPGHFLQFLYAPRFRTKTRKLIAAASNGEGWAHYCEEMVVDHGFGGGDARMRLAQLSEALLRDCRYVAGIKLHTAGWTVDEATSLFQEQCFQEPANARAEAVRGTYNPTYLYYTFGKLEIKELAREYMEKKHATLKQFHDAFVAQGALPIAVVRKLLFQ